MRANKCLWASLPIFSLMVCFYSSHSLANETCDLQTPVGEFVVTEILSTRANRGEPGLYEGPVWINDALYFSDFTFGKGFPSKIRRINALTQFETFLDGSGSNGLAVLGDQIYLASHKEKGIVKLSLNATSQQLLIDKFLTAPFNSPNDLVVLKDETILFTDPNFQKGTAIGQEITGVYQRDSRGHVSLIDATISNPNGITISKDESTLFVSGGGENGYVNRYSKDDKGLWQPVRFIENVHVPDGMTMDCHHNLYVTEHLKQRVRVFDRLGKEIAQAKLPQNVTNLVIGGSQNDTLFVTAAESIFMYQFARDN